jgi:hypothetical protein
MSGYLAAFPPSDISTYKVIGQGGVAVSAFLPWQPEIDHEAAFLR